MNLGRDLSAEGRHRASVEISTGEGVGAPISYPSASSSTSLQAIDLKSGFCPISTYWADSRTSWAEYQHFWGGYKHLPIPSRC